MACVSEKISGLLNQCEAAKGGLVKIYIATYKDDLGITYNDEKTCVTGFGEDVEFYQYYIRKNVASFTSTLTVDPANGVSFVTTELNLVFTKMTTEKRIEMSALALNDLLVVVEDANGVKWVLGRENACYVSAGTGETGVQPTDGSKYTLTITDVSDTYPFEFKGTITPKNV